MKFVSHLDMTRVMSRLIKKSNVPVWYTEGFNQRIYLTFALPLSLGFESEYEIMEFRLTDDEYDLNTCLEALKSVCPPDIEFFAINGGEMPMKTIGFSRFELKFEDFNFSKELSDFLNREQILCRKTGKKGKVKEIDLIPKIKAFEITENGVNLTLVAGSEDNLNPSLVISAFFELCGIEPVYYTVNRTMIYNRENREFK